MAGRNAKPIALHLAEGNPNRLTKAEIEARQDTEVKLGTSDLDSLKPPTFVTGKAKKLWDQLIAEYKSAAEQGVELLMTSDIGILALYCKTFTEYERLQKSHKDVLKAYNNNMAAAIETLIKIETAINKKMDMLLKMQDRLFLNPLAKVKNVPKSKKEAPKSRMAEFMNRRGANGT